MNIRPYFLICITILLAASANGQKKDINSDPDKQEHIEEEVFNIVEQMPRFPGCEDMRAPESQKMECSKKKMFEYVYGNLTHPIEAKEKGIEGRTVVHFTIEADGRINDVQLLRDIGMGCGEASVAVIQKMIDDHVIWTPGRQRGKAVRVQFTLPIKFKYPGLEPAIADTDTEEIFKVVEQMPRFPGCDSEGMSTETIDACSGKKMLEYVYMNLRYPAKARENGIEGTTVVQFVVQKDGTVADIKLIRDIGGDCGAASYAVIQKMVDENITWTPGMQRGKAVKVLYTLPIKFKLEGPSRKWWQFWK